jgi:hypothetical protein
MADAAATLRAFPVDDDAVDAETCPADLLRLSMTGAFCTVISGGHML